MFRQLTEESPGAKPRDCHRSNPHNLIKIDKIQSLLINAPKRRLFATLKNYIGGEFRPPSNGAYTDVFSPIDESLVAKQPSSAHGDVERAVACARAAFRDWSLVEPETRAGILRKIADGVEANADTLAALESVNAGKPKREADADVADAVATFRYYAGLAEELQAEFGGVALKGDHDTACTMVREPRGVVAAIIPWNYPLLIHAWKMAPALAAGCCVVVKPSEVTPCSAYELAKIVNDTQLPKGVYNVVFGTGPETGAALTLAEVDRITFTGSLQTGRVIMRNASENLVPVSLELGGKSPMIVLEDARDDLIEWIMMGVFFNAGQVCSATSRLFLPDSIADRVIEQLKLAAGKITFPSKHLQEWVQDESILMGPIVNKAQFDKVRAYIESADAKIHAGGLSRPTSKGYFVAPTILEPSLDSLVWKEEIFGPVLCVHRYTTIEEAIQLANDTPFGLACSVMSCDVRKARQIAKRIKCGIRWINCSQPTLIEAPWSGRKRSGFGGDLGRQALDQNLVSTQITERTTPFTWFT